MIVSDEKPAHGAPDEICDAMRSGLCAHVVMDDATADALMLAARVYVHSMWDHAVALAAEDGSVPMVAGEAWVEGDEAYMARMGVRCSESPVYAGTAAAQMAKARTLDKWGERHGLPRARLVPAEDRP